MKKYFLYDGRYLTNPDDAVCFEICDSLQEAQENKIDYGANTVVVEAIIQGKDIKSETIITEE